MKAVVFTLGCKVNECESDSLIAGLKDRGYEVSDKLEPADLYIVNTCAVTSEAEKKSRQTSARIKKLNPNARVIFTGCAVQKDYKPFVDKDNASLITGVFSKNKILDMLDQTGVCIADEDRAFEELLPVCTQRARAFIKVQDGCDNFCSYCIIPYLRGRSRSRNPQNIVQEIKSICPKEVVINGINLSSYDYNGIKLDGLIKSFYQFDCRIRLGSLEARVITNELLTALKGLKNFAPHFHLSLQSGANNVLKKMNRKYTAQEYLEKVQQIRQYFPLAAITTDIIVGFPTETEQDFLQTLEFTDEVRFADIHPFIFSARSGTVAYKMKELPYPVKKQRIDKLIEKKAQLKSQFTKQMLGQELFFLFEEYKDGFAVGYTENYLRVYIKDFVDNQSLRKVVIDEEFNDGALAHVID